jgi:hypothetical protein
MNSRRPLFTSVLVIVVAVLVAAVATVWFLRQRREEKAAGPLAHGRTAFSFTVAAAKDRVFPLFGASGERAWGDSGHGDPWDPHFIWPTPEHDVEGAVFTITHRHGMHHKTATWINTAFDPGTGHIQYVYFVPDAMVTRIDLSVTPIDAASTKVDVVYDQTALTAAANATIQERTEHADDMGKEWKEQVTKALGK